MPRPDGSLRPLPLRRSDPFDVPPRGPGREQPDRSTHPTREPGTVTVRLSGELDTATERDLAYRITVALRRAGDGPVVVDLADATFCDVAGLRGLLMFDDDRRRQLRYANPPTTVRRLLTILDITDIAIIDAQQP
jgi:anti-sigma B factor antagonist